MKAPSGISRTSSGSHATRPPHHPGTRAARPVHAYSQSMHHLLSNADTASVGEKTDAKADTRDVASASGNASHQRAAATWLTGSASEHWGSKRGRAVARPWGRGGGGVRVRVPLRMGISHRGHTGRIALSRPRIRSHGTAASGDEAAREGGAAFGVGHSTSVVTALDIDVHAPSTLSGSIARLGGSGLNQSIVSEVEISIGADTDLDDLLQPDESNPNAWRRDINPFARPTNPTPRHGFHHRHTGSNASGSSLLGTSGGLSPEHSTDMHGSESPYQVRLSSPLLLFFPLPFYCPLTRRAIHPLSFSLSLHPPTFFAPCRRQLVLPLKR